MERNPRRQSIHKHDIRQVTVNLLLFQFQPYCVYPRTDSVYSDRCECRSVASFAKTKIPGSTSKKKVSSP